MNLEENYKIIQDGHPRLRFCEQFDDTSSIWNYSRHSHPYLELMYFLEGKGNITVSDKHLSISLFDTVVYPAWWAHQEDAVSERRRRIICLWVDLPELTLDAPLQVRDEGDALGDVFRLVYREAKREPQDAAVLEYSLKLLLTLVLRSQAEARLQEGHLAVVLQYIHTYYTERITLDDLAELEHISKSYLSRLFKKRTGMTVVEYVNHLRLDAARRLLVGTAQGVNEIAYQTGFESPKYFYRTFKTAFGESPASFRKRYKNVPRENAQDGAKPDAT